MKWNIKYCREAQHTLKYCKNQYFDVTMSLYNLINLNFKNIFTFLSYQVNSFNGFMNQC